MFRAIVVLLIAVYSSILECRSSCTITEVYVESEKFMLIVQIPFCIHALYPTLAKHTHTL